jgi:hypothetical protein
MEPEAGSLLNLYRRLIHLRAENRELGAGELVPLDASSDAVAAYLRRTEQGAALIVANLGSSPLPGVALSSAAAVLPPGEYSPRALLGGEAAAPLPIAADGRIRSWVPVASLGPMEVRLYHVAAAR